MLEVRCVAGMTSSNSIAWTLAWRPPARDDITGLESWVCGFGGSISVLGLLGISRVDLLRIRQRSCRCAAPLLFKGKDVQVIDSSCGGTKHKSITHAWFGLLPALRVFDTLKWCCLYSHAQSPPLVGQLVVCGLADLGRDQLSVLRPCAWP